MSKKKRRPIPVTTVGKKLDEAVVVFSGIERARQKRPYLVPGFRSGPYMSDKDRPRDKNWKKWV